MKWLPDDMWFSVPEAGRAGGRTGLRPRRCRQHLGVVADFVDTGVAAPESLSVGSDQPGLPRWPLYAGLGVAMRRTDCRSGGGPAGITWIRGAQSHESAP